MKLIGSSSTVKFISCTTPEFRLLCSIINLISVRSYKMICQNNTVPQFCTCGLSFSTILNSQ